MIPRLKPYLDWREVSALLRIPSGAVAQFESKFTETFQSQCAIAYPYGRTALWAFFKALALQDAEIIMPAYTCSVVAHAIVLSNNTPRFVDVSLNDYNMPLDAIERTITSKTRAIVATHLFGYPMDMRSLQAIVRDAEAKYGHKIWLISDCAHSFGAKYQGESVVNAADVALFGLNISKTISSIFGGMLITNDAELDARLRQWRDKHFAHPGILKALRRRLYLLAIYGAFQNQVYSFVYWLQNATSLLSPLTDSYHLDDKIHFPPDFQEQLLPVEASVGLQQLEKYNMIIEKRCDNARFYHENLLELASDSFVLPPMLEGATYSHYVIRVENRPKWLESAAKAGIQLGQLIEYSMPELPSYKSYANGNFPNAGFAMSRTINLPVNACVTKAEREKIVHFIKKQLETSQYER